MRGLVVAIFMFGILAPPAGALTLAGSVREKGTRTPVPGALLFIEGGETETYSDENGNFVLVDDVPGEGRELQVQSPGYGTEVLLVNGAENSTIELDIYLTPDSSVASTVVRERRSPADRARGAVRIEENEVNELPGTYGDPAKAIENFPGMGRVVLSQGSLFVRGSSPSDTAVYVDDFEVPDLYHFTGSTSVINIPFVQSVELVPGAFSARYGRATGGLVSLHTRKLPTDDFHGFAKADVIDAGAYVGIPVSENAALGMSGRRSWLDAIRWAQRANGAAVDDILNIPTYWDWQLKYDWDVKPGHELVVFAFGSGDRQINIRDGGANAAPYQSVDDSDFARVSLRYRHVLGDGFTHTFLPVVGYERRFVNEQLGLRVQERQTLDAQLRDELTWRGEGSRILIGLDATLRHDAIGFGGVLAADPTRAMPSADLEGSVRAQRVDRSALRGTLGLYTEGTFEPMPRLSLTPGLRLDNYLYGDVPIMTIEPRFAGSYAMTDGAYGLMWKASAGAFSQPPLPEDVVAARLYGRELSPQEALHLQAGFEQQLGDLASFTTTLYGVWRSQVPERSVTFPIAPSPFLSPVAMTSAGRSIGAEVLFRLQKTRDYFGWVSYSVARHERFDGRAASAVPYAYSGPTDTTHLLTALAQVRLPFGIRAGARYRLATGMPFTEVTGAVFDADSGQYLPVFGAKAGARYPTFHVLDARIDWSWLLPWCELDLYADLVNVLNLRFEEGRVYTFDYSEYAPRLGLPVIPTVGAKMTF